MKFYQYWAMADMPATDAKGKKLRLKKWAGSDDSAADAENKARRALQDLAARLANVAAGFTGDTYAYGLRDMPEELIEKLGDKTAITRNRYGCLVLNTQECLFADIDLPRIGFIAKLRGMTREKQEAESLARLNGWLEQHRDAAVRVYRTAGGLRYLFTHKPLAVNDDTTQWLKDLGSDPLYTRLCRQQDCFRARLEPKPWRLGLPQPPARFPFAGAQDKAMFDQWHRSFSDKSQDRAVCTYIDTLGSRRVHETLEALVKAHDKATRAQDNGLTLA